MNLQKVVNENNSWINIVLQYILPIVLSVIVIIQNRIYNKQNKRCNRLY
jgi:hypothetical protein